jgi:hypothetical protein
MHACKQEKKRGQAEKAPAQVGGKPPNLQLARDLHNFSTSYPVFVTAFGPVSSRATRFFNGTICVKDYHIPLKPRDQVAPMGFKREIQSL